MNDSWKHVGVFGGTVAAAVVAFSSTAVAAVSATVAVDGAKVHEKPNAGSPVIDTLPIGTMLRLGNKSQDGWRRAAIPIGDQRGKIGWIQEDAVNIIDVSTVQGLDEAARAPKKKLPSTSRLFGGVSLSFYSKSATDSSLATQMTYLAQGSYLVSKHFSFGLRGMVTPVTSSTTGTSGATQSTTEYGISFLVPFEFAFVAGDTLQLFAGVGPSVALPIASGGKLTFGGAGYVGLSLYLSDNLFLRADGGYAMVSTTDTQGASTLTGNPMGIGVLGIDF